KAQRFFHDHGIGPGPQRAVALASYHHAQFNPRAVMYGRPLTPDAYDQSRWIVEPFRLYDCCQENDGAAAVIVTSPERARDLRKPPVWFAAAAQGSGERQGAGAHNEPLYGTSNFGTVARRLWEMAGVGPRDVQVVQ